MHYIQFIHITPSLNPFHSSSYPNMASPSRPLHLWLASLRGDPLMWIRAWRWVRTEPPWLLQVLFAKGRPTRWACAATRPWLSPLEMARRGEIPQIHRRPGKPEHKLQTSAATQQPTLIRDCMSVWLCPLWLSEISWATSAIANRSDCSDTLHTTSFCLHMPISRLSAVAYLT